MKRLRQALPVAAAAFITLVGLEALVRVWGFSERHLYDPIYTRFPGSRDIPYVHKPNLRRAKAGGLAVIDTDALGLRTMGCFNLARLYGQGDGVPKDEQRAAALHEKGCDGGYGSACNALGVMNFSGTGVPKDRQRSAVLYEKACTSGSLNGCGNLVRKDEQRAAVLYEKACDGGFGRGCGILATSIGRATASPKTSLAAQLSSRRAVNSRTPTPV